MNTMMIGQKARYQEALAKFTGNLARAHRSILQASSRAREESTYLELFRDGSFSLSAEEDEWASGSISLALPRYSREQLQKLQRHTDPEEVEELPLILQGLRDALAHAEKHI